MTEPSLSMSAYHLARKYARQGAYVTKVKIADSWVSKCFLTRCPKSSKKLPGMLTVTRLERCIESNCDYERQVYTPAEFAFLDSAYRRELLPPDRKSGSAG